MDKTEGTNERTGAEAREVGMDFPLAYRKLAQKKSVARHNWHGKGLKITMQFPDEHSKMGTTYLYITMPDGTNIPWLPSQTDLNQVDWHVVD